ncbi:BrnT family toxin [Duganella sp. CT11-25]|jgi:uncharacterized DUF497 family protein|uniref:BrnT family toxin n=1 Tax=unclassified Duganella TaxID=2636909 RepID=UPI0039B0231C
MHNPSKDIEFDPAKAKSNLIKHKVSFSQAEEALNDPMSITIEIPDADGEQRFSTVGTDAVGRILVVIHTPRGNRTRVISARKASKSEAEQYHG